MNIVAFTQNQRNEVRELYRAGCLSAQPGMKQQTYVAALTNLGSGGPDDNEAQAGHLVPIAEVGAKTQMGAGRNGCGIGNEGDPMFTLQAGKQHAVGVRRLTPTECERLQGFPDGWTCRCMPIESYDSERCTCSDGPRYRMLGNAVTENVIRHLGTMILDVERGMRRR